ncbi:long-chain-fatty-acid--CoA ligase [Sandaracinobacteroides saxicola]|uniref:Long-chain fatty acid--CoA ligase n=1 Tax=Sandaracinobacteroides saxicola TaxID=2759707 RepID=A0A7G5IDM1_9SPHN|nr:long-chain fatty acid--CoA ligase [Sandaracinobacteroides saxicola]QMW21463.1 long-chain fatty acid--CoA ligase [Sandaracinobacteroides saxicola]
MSVYQHPVAFDRVFEPLWLPEMLRRTAERQPTKPCIDFLGRVSRYGEIWDAVRRAATGFAAMGVGPGSTVGLFLPNCPHYVIAYFGALMAGARLANFSPLYTVAELRAQVEDSDCDVMVTLDAAALYPTIAKVLETSRLKTLIVGSVAEALPPAKALLYRMFRRRERSKVSWDARHVTWRSLLTHPRMMMPSPLPDPQALALLQYTGGTTGAPKGAMLSHANLSINAQQVDSIDPEPQAEDRILGALPLFHIFANTCIMNRTIVRGGMMVLLPKFEVKAALSAIARTKVTALPGVPTMYRALLDYPEAAKFDLSSLRVCISGGAPMPEPVKTAFVARTGATLVEGYGLTESAGVVSTNPYASGGKAGTIGQPLPGTVVVLVDKDDPTKPAREGEAGELTFRGPPMMSGYWKRDNAGVFVDGRLRTGDLATVDADGFYTIVDRLKDMIIVGGFKVFPSVVEEVLYRHPAVNEALVIGVHDEYLGERPKAFVTLHAGAEASAESLLAFVNANIGKHERLVACEVRDSLPKTMIGKLSRKELVAEEKAKRT